MLRNNLYLIVSLVTAYLLMKATCDHLHTEDQFVTNIPYVVKVHSSYNCSGVLIDAEWVLTAAHCFGSSRDGVVIYDEIEVRSKSVHLNPNYKAPLIPGSVRVGEGDIALIRLEKKMTFLSSKLRTIKLDDGGWPQDSQSGRFCMAAGYGGHRGTELLPQQRHGEDFYASHGVDACRDVPKEKKLNLICSEGDNFNHTFCDEDFGGPLVCDSKLTGILHFICDIGHCSDEFDSQVVCDAPNSMSLAMYICPYLDWIRNHVGGDVPKRPKSCRAVFSAPSQYIYWERKVNLICTDEDNNNHTFCNEDFGGPLVCDSKLTGILHYVCEIGHCYHEFDSIVVCDSGNSMSLAMFICPYLDWIRNHVGQNVPKQPKSCRAVFSAPTQYIYWLLLYYVLRAV